MPGPVHMYMCTNIQGAPDPKGEIMANFSTCGSIAIFGWLIFKFRAIASAAYAYAY